MRLIDALESPYLTRREGFAGTHAVLRSGVVFYTIIFAGCAVLLVVGGLLYYSRNRRRFEAEKRTEASAAHAHRRQRNASRAQSRKDRRKRR